MSNQEILRREPFSASQLQALERSFSAVERIITGFDGREIDVEFGRGVLNSDRSGQAHCIWNKRGVRFTIWFSVDGGSGMSAGRDPDPYYLEQKCSAASQSVQSMEQ